MQVYATGFLPYIGKVLNFLLLSWMYAYYCFEYVVHIHLCLMSSNNSWVHAQKYSFLLGTNGTSMKCLSTEGSSTLNLTGHFLLVLVSLFINLIALTFLCMHVCFARENSCLDHVASFDCFCRYSWDRTIFPAYLLVKKRKKKKKNIN